MKVRHSLFAHLSLFLVSMLFTNALCMKSLCSPSQWTATVVNESLNARHSCTPTLAFSSWHVVPMVHWYPHNHAAFRGTGTAGQGVPFRELAGVSLQAASRLLWARCLERTFRNGPSQQLAAAALSPSCLRSKGRCVWKTQETKRQKEEDIGPKMTTYDKRLGRYPDLYGGQCFWARVDGIYTLDASDI